VQDQKFNDLLSRYLNDTITPEEKQELMELYRSIGFNNSEYPDNRNSVRKRILKRLKEEIKPPKTGPLSIEAWRLIAASVAIFMISALIFQRLSAPPGRVAANIHTQMPIVPGANTATLTLGSGKKITLNTAKSGMIAVIGRTAIVKNAGGQITYDVAADDKTSPVEYNTVSTPRGGQFKVSLPDGTNVWLNAASSLTYPSAFRGNDREVSLTGEAYFEVAKNIHQPFIVTANYTQVRVLGTHFNVMAYKDEARVATTLLEGSVILRSGNADRKLVPGQQGLAGQVGEKIDIQQVDTNYVIAWKNGYFSFKNEGIKTVMNKIGRWYNVDIEYKGTPTDDVMGGSVSRTANIKELLGYLELTDLAKFKIEGRKIVVICK